jgi:hypothetical protein
VYCSLGRKEKDFAGIALFSLNAARVSQCKLETKEIDLTCRDKRERERDREENMND